MEIDDINDIDDIDVQVLIHKLKHPIKKISYQSINKQLLSLFGKIDINEAIIDDDDDIEYILHVYRGRIDANRFSLHIRFKENNYHLIRIDINPSGHHDNPDGKRITNSHMHIYSNHQFKRDAWAVPLTQTTFPNVTTIINAFTDFEKYNNIKII